MLNAKVEQALNAQINAEFWSAYLYLSMSADAMQKGTKASPTGSRYNSRKNRHMLKFSLTTFRHAAAK